MIIYQAAGFADAPGWLLTLACSWVWNAHSKLCISNYKKELDVFFVKQASGKWNVGSELWKVATKNEIVMHHCETDYLEVCNSLFQTVKYVIWKMRCWNRLTSEKWNIRSELWNSNYVRWNCNVSLWKLVFWNVKYTFEFKHSWKMSMIYLIWKFWCKEYKYKMFYNWMWFKRYRYYKLAIVNEIVGFIVGEERECSASLISCKVQWWGQLLKEIRPRGNNKVVIYISLYPDKCLLFMLELY